MQEKHDDLHRLFCFRESPGYSYLKFSLMFRFKWVCPENRRESGYPIGLQYKNDGNT